MKNWMYPGIDFSGLRDAMEPPALRMMRGLQQSIKNDFGGHTIKSAALADFHKDALRPTNAVMEAAASLKAITGPGTEVMRAKDSLSQTMAGLAGIKDGLGDPFHKQLGITTNSLDTISRSLKSFGIAEHFAGAKTLDSIIAATMPTMKSQWAAHFDKDAFAPLLAIQKDWAEPIGILRAVEETTAMSLMWGKRETKLRLAGLFEEADDSVHELDDGSDDVTIAPVEEVVCGICEEPMISIGKEFTLSGSPRGLFRTRIIPYCPECCARDGREPGFLQRALSDLLKYGVVWGIRKTVDGKGHGDGVARGRLSLVRKPKKGPPKGEQ